ncbi:MAG: dimethylsulfonioproprionate lyase family protein [Pseudomonadota bacterium]
MEQAPTLQNAPDWQYLLREFYELYRGMPSGGSEKIRSHLRAVREAISRTEKMRPTVARRSPSQLPVLGHFKRALDRGRMDRLEGTIRAIESVQDDLSFQLGYEKVPRGLENRYAYAEFAGPTGPVITPHVILGIVLFAPGCVYPAHAHRGITESYVCLSGSVSENHQGVYAPGSLIFNPPEHTHRITVSNRDPALLAYAWVGDPAELAGQKMVFSRAARRTKESPPN